MPEHLCLACFHSPFNCDCTTRFTTISKLIGGWPGLVICMGILVALGFSIDGLVRQ